MERGGARQSSGEGEGRVRGNERGGREDKKHERCSRLNGTAERRRSRAGGRAGGRVSKEFPALLSGCDIGGHARAPHDSYLSPRGGMHGTRDPAWD